MSQALDYTKIKSIAWIYNEIPYADESAVQTFHDNINQLLYPVNEGFLHCNQVLQDRKKTDNLIRYIYLIGPTGAKVEVFEAELKRYIKETPKLQDFYNVAAVELDKKIDKTKNPAGWVLYGGIGIGNHYVFFKKTHTGENEKNQPLQPAHEGMLHIWKDASTIVEWHEYIKGELKKQLLHFGLEMHAPNSITAPFGHNLSHGLTNNPSSSGFASSSKHASSSTYSSQGGKWSEWEWEPAHNCEKRWRMDAKNQYEYEYR